MPKSKSKTSKTFSVTCEGTKADGKKVTVTADKGKNIYKGCKDASGLKNHDHAEMRVLESMSAAERITCALEINAYPCDQCDVILKHLSTADGGGATITVTVTSTKYHEDHRGPLNAAGIAMTTTPVRIVYMGGHPTYTAA